MLGNRYNNMNKVESHEIWRNNRSSEIACTLVGNISPKIKPDDKPNVKPEPDEKPALKEKKQETYPPIVTIDGRVDTDIDHLIEDLADDYHGPVVEVPSKYPKPHMFSVIEGSLDDDVDSFANDDGTMEHTLVDAPKTLNAKDLQDVTKDGGKKSPATTKGEKTKATDSYSQSADRPESIHSSVSPPPRSHNKMNVESSEIDASINFPRENDTACLPRTTCLEQLKRGQLSCDLSVENNHNGGVHKQDKKCQDQDSRIVIRDSFGELETHTPHTESEREAHQSSSWGYRVHDPNNGQVKTKVTKSHSNNTGLDLNRALESNRDAEYDSPLNSRAVVARKCDSEAYASDESDCHPSLKEFKQKDTESAAYMHACAESLSCTYTDESFREGYMSMHVSGLKVDQDRSECVSESDSESYCHEQIEQCLERHENEYVGHERNLRPQLDHTLFNVPSYSNDSLIKSSELCSRNMYLIQNNPQISFSHTKPNQKCSTIEAVIISSSVKSSRTALTSSLNVLNSNPSLDSGRNQSEISTNDEDRKFVKMKLLSDNVSDNTIMKTRSHDERLSDFGSITQGLFEADNYKTAVSESSIVSESNPQQIAHTLRKKRAHYPVSDQNAPQKIALQRSPIIFVKELNTGKRAQGFANKNQQKSPTPNENSVLSSNTHFPTPTKRSRKEDASEGLTRENLRNTDNSPSRECGVQVKMEKEPESRMEKAISDNKDSQNKCEKADVTMKSNRIIEYSSTGGNLTAVESDTESLDYESLQLLHQLQVAQTTNKKTTTLLKHAQKIVGHSGQFSERGPCHVVPGQGVKAGRTGQEVDKMPVSEDKAPKTNITSVVGKSVKHWDSNNGDGSESIGKDAKVPNLDHMEIINLVQARDNGLKQTRDRGLIETRDRSLVEKGDGSLVEKVGRGLAQKWERGLIEKRDINIIEKGDRRILEKGDRSLVEKRDRNIIEKGDRGILEKGERGAGQKIDRGLVETRRKSLMEKENKGQKQTRDCGVVQRRDRCHVEPGELSLAQTGDVGLVQSLVSSWDKHHQRVFEDKEDNKMTPVSVLSRKKEYLEKWTDKSNDEMTFESETVITPQVNERKVPIHHKSQNDKDIRASEHQQNLQGKSYVRYQIKDSKEKEMDRLHQPDSIEKSRFSQKSDTLEQSTAQGHGQRRKERSTTFYDSPRMTSDSSTTDCDYINVSPTRNKHGRKYSKEDALKERAVSAPRKLRDSLDLKRRESPDVYSCRDAGKSKQRNEIGAKRSRSRASSIKDSLRAAFKVAEESMTAAARVTKALNMVMKASQISLTSSSSVEDSCTTSYPMELTKSKEAKQKLVANVPAGKMKSKSASDQTPKQSPKYPRTKLDNAVKSHARNFDEMSQSKDRRKLSPDVMSFLQEQSYNHNTSLSSPSKRETFSRNPKNDRTCRQKQKPQTVVPECRGEASHNSMTLEEHSPQAWGDTSKASTDINDKDQPQIIVHLAYSSSPSYTQLQGKHTDGSVMSIKKQQVKDPARVKLIKSGDMQQVRSVESRRMTNSSHCIVNESRSPDMSACEQSMQQTLPNDEWPITRSYSGRKTDSYFTQVPPVIDKNLQSISLSTKQILRRRMIGSCVDPGHADSSGSESLEFNSNFNKAVVAKHLHLSLAHIEQQKDQFFVNKCSEEYALSRSHDQFLLWQEGLQRDSESFPSEPSEFGRSNMGNRSLLNSREDSQEMAYRCMTRSHQESCTHRRETVHARDNRGTSYQLREEEIVQIGDYFESWSIKQEQPQCVATLCYTDLSSPASSYIGDQSVDGDYPCPVEMGDPLFIGEPDHGVDTNPLSTEENCHRDIHVLQKGESDPTSSVEAKLFSEAHEYTGGEQVVQPPKPRARKLQTSDADTFPYPGRVQQMRKFSPIFEEVWSEDDTEHVKDSFLLRADFLGISQNTNNCIRNGGNVDDDTDEEYDIVSVYEQSDFSDDDRGATVPIIKRNVQNSECHWAKSDHCHDNLECKIRGDRCMSKISSLDGGL